MKEKHSNRQLKADYIRRFGIPRVYHGRILYEISNRQILKLYKYGLLKVNE